MRRTALAVAVLTASASLLAACGGGSSGGGSTDKGSGSQSAQAELVSSVQALASSSTLTASVKLGGTGSQVLAFVKAEKKGVSLTPAQAADIAGVSINFEVAAPKGETLSQLSGLTEAGAAANISVVDGGTTLLDIRFVNGTLYLQADLKDVLNDIGKASTYRQMAAAASSFPGFLSALVEDKWVSLPVSTLKQLTGSGASGSTSTPAASSHQFLAAVEGLLTKDVTVTRTSSGDTDHLTLMTNARTLVGDVTSTFDTLVPSAGSILGGIKPSSAPDKSVTLNATVTNGALSALTFDLGQLAKNGSLTLPLALAIAQGGTTISAPSGATAVDVSTLDSLLGSLGGSGL
ncbi:MAG TPA: hypothetical protein VHW74_08355 [Mycobacteriales bacterium]|jgi:hypothetical protein|nr:hypothetical protein [Mycobacteriales bacterium]